MVEIVFEAVLSLGIRDIASANGPGHGIVQLYAMVD